MRKSDIRNPTMARTLLDVAGGHLTEAKKAITANDKKEARLAMRRVIILVKDARRRL